KVSGVRSIYALSLSGLLARSDWPRASLPGRSDGVGLKRKTSSAARRPSRIGSADVAAKAIDETSELEALFARLESAADHYEVLELGRFADIEEIKTA